MTDKASPKNSGLLFYTFVFLAGVVIAAAVLSALGKLQEPAPPWGVFTQAAHVGEPPADGRTLTRSITADGFPIVNPSDPRWTTVRCGPKNEVPIVSARSWEILGGAGPINAGRGVTEGFSFGPFDGVPDGFDQTRRPPPCYVISFGSVPLDPDVLAQADGRPIRFTLRMSSPGFSTVNLTSEWFVVGGRPANVSQLDISIPRISPIR